MLKKVTTMFIALALLVSLSGIGSAEAINNSCDCSSWLTYMGDYGRTSSSNCDINPLSPHFREIWKSEKIGPSIIGDQPLIYDGKLITSSAPYLFSDDEKYAKKNTAKLVCMDANSGNIMWSNPLSGWGSVATGSINTENNTIIIGSGHDPSTKYEKNEMETGVFCVDIDTGKNIWTYISPYGIGTCGAIADGNYYVGTHRALFICLDANNGKLKWSTKPKNNIGFYMPLSTACYLDNSLFSCSYDGTLTSYNKDDGTQSWAKDLNFFGFQMITPSVWNEKLVVTTPKGKVLLFDSKGNEIWSCQVEKLDRYEEISSATVYNDKIFIITNPVEENNDGQRFYSDSILYSIDANDGTVLGSKTLEYHISHPVSTPIVSNGYIFLNAYFDHVDIFSTDDLELLSSITPEDGLISTPLSIYEDKLYFGLHTGEMVCYGVSPFTPLRLDYGSCYLKTNHEETVEIKNIYDKELEFLATTTSDWFSLTNNSGVLKPGESVFINVNTIPEKINRVGTVYSDTLIVQLGEEKNSIPVKLQTIYPAKVTLSPHPIVCEIGGILDISANSFGENGELLSGYEFDWEISDSTIGNLSYNGTFYGKKIGTAEIKATVSPLSENGLPVFGLSDVQVIKIRDPIIPSSIDFGEVLLGKTQTMELEIKNESFRSVNIKLKHNESWFNLDRTSLNVAGGNTVIILVTLVNSEFKAGDEKIGYIETSWNNGSQKVSVTAKTNEDTLPPKITILGLEEKVTDLSEVTLSGSTDEKCEIFINGEVVAEDDDSFEFVFKLKKAPSKNSVVITATDSAGNTSTMEFEIINNHMLTIKTSINNKILYTDGVPVELDVAPTIVNGRTLAPFRAIAEAFGAEVGWISQRLKL